MITATAIRNFLYDLRAEELRRFIGALIGITVVFLAAYGYFVATTVVNMVEYHHAVARTAELNAELGQLESRYIELGQSMTIERAHTLGFVDVSDPHFVALGSSQRLTLAVTAH